MSKLIFVVTDSIKEEGINARKIHFATSLGLAEPREVVDLLMEGAFDAHNPDAIRNAPKATKPMAHPIPIARAPKRGSAIKGNPNNAKSDPRFEAPYKK